MYTIIFLVRGSSIDVFCISRIIDDFCEEKGEEGYSFNSDEIVLLDRMREDYDLFERVVNDAKSDELGYLVAVSSVPYIEERRRNRS